MSFLYPNPDRQRAVLETAFEQDGDGYLYYRNAWSGGIPVSAAEREFYLNAPVLGGQRDFHRAIKGRTTTTPPRAYGAASIRIASAMPWPMTVLGVIGGIVVATWFYSDLALPLRIICLLAGLTMTAVFLRVAYSKVFNRLPR